MTKTGLIYACGKSKVMYYGSREDTFEMHFIDSVSSFTQNKQARIPGTGEVRADFSSYVFKHIEKKGLPTHFISQIGSGILEVKKLEMLKLEIIPRNIAAGSIVRNFPIQRGHVFNPPVLKMDLKYENDPMLNSDYILALGIATKKEVSLIRELALDLNETLRDLLKGKGILLVDFKFEVGRNSNGEIVIGDEISPDGMRMWDAESGESFDKDVFRYGTGDLLEVYKQITKRVFGDQ